jgi:hypothetical protein
MCFWKKSRSFSMIRVEKSKFGVHGEGKGECGGRKSLPEQNRGALAGQAPFVWQKRVEWLGKLRKYQKTRLVCLRRALSQGAKLGSREAGDGEDGRETIATRTISDQ